MEKYDNSLVRRQDRLLEIEKAEYLLKNGEYGVLSFVETLGEGCGAYGIPINFVWDGEDCIFFHCAPQGHKLNCIDHNSLGSLCVVGNTNVVSNKFTTAYESIVVRGELSHNLSEEERMNALELFLDKYAPNDKVVGRKYAEKSFHRTEIICLKIKSISGKQKVVS